ncbi:hypothetical protein DsansV1_C23g0176231 [Dioscorea sansibarensis]
MLMRIHLQSSRLLPGNLSPFISSPLPRNPSLLPFSTQRRAQAPIVSARRERKVETLADIKEAEVDSEEEEYGEEGEELEDDGFAYPNAFMGRDGEKDYDRDPVFAEILGTCVDDPQKAQSRVEERIRKKRSKILHAKTGSAKPMKVLFNKFGFSNSFIWFEFYNAPLTKDIKLICDTIRSWFIIGRLGGCNSMNMQLSEAPLENKRPSYDPIYGANVTPTTFYNIGDLEIQDNLARIWVDIGTTEPLLLDVLINALFNISSDFVGIKQLVFGGSEFENWRENLTSEDAGCSTHKI